MKKIKTGIFLGMVNNLTKRSMVLEVDNGVAELARARFEYYYIPSVMVPVKKKVAELI